jgi:hypothetical protein
MGKRAFLRSFAVDSALMAALFLPVCKGACCFTNTPNLSVRQFSAVRAPLMKQDQEPANPNPQNPSSPARKIKVWTNEELIATRTPADVYIFAKESQAAALEDEAFKNLISCFAVGQTEGNADETQKEIDATVQSIRDSEEAVAQSRKALSTAPANLKLRNQMELAERTAELNHARERLWKLQEHLQELQKAPTPTPALETTAPAQQPPDQPAPN